MTTPKDDVVHLEKAPDATPETSSDNVEEALDDDPVYTRAEQRKIIHRVDRRLISVAGIIYMNSLMDRSNLPNAMIAGMDVDLGLRGNSRYVSMLPHPFSLVFRLICYSVYHCPGILHHVHIFPASRHASHA